MPRGLAFLDLDSGISVQSHGAALSEGRRIRYVVLNRFTLFQTR